MRIGLAILAAVTWGSSTAYAGMAARKSSVIGLAFWSQVLGLAIAWPVVIFAGSKVLDLHVLAMGAIAGAGVAAGLLLLYVSTRYVFVGVASAVSAVVACAGPVLITSANHPLTGQGEVGLLVCLVAISMVARWRKRATPGLDFAEVSNPPPGSSTKVLGELAGLVLASLSGVGMGVYYWALGGTSVRAQLWEAMDSRAVSAFLLGVVAVVVSKKSLAVSVPRIRFAAPVALLGIIGAISYATAVSASSLSVVVPISSLSPVITVMLGWTLLKERASRAQVVALALSMVGVVLLST